MFVCFFLVRMMLYHLFCFVYSQLAKHYMLNILSSFSCFIPLVISFGAVEPT